MNADRQVIKAINRWVRKTRPFGSQGRQHGVDFATWAVVYPHIALEFQKAAVRYTGRQARFLPWF